MKKCTECIYYVEETRTCYLLNIVVDDPENPPCIRAKMSPMRSTPVKVAEAPKPAPELRVEAETPPHLELKPIVSPWYRRVEISEDDYAALGRPEYVWLRTRAAALKTKVFVAKMRRGVIYLPTSVSRVLKVGKGEKVLVEVAV